MANIRWTGVSGDWSTSSDWSANTVPGLSDKAVISAAGSLQPTVSSIGDPTSLLLEFQALMGPQGQALPKNYWELGQNVSDCCRSNRELSIQS